MRTAITDPGQGFERMPTGIAGLDHLLDGGLVRGNSLLIEGPPGSGKSSVAMRILYEGIVKYSEPALMITFEEFPRQVYLEALQFGIDLKPLEAAGLLRLVWTPPARILKSFSGKLDLVDKIVEEIGVRRLVIDSITHFRRVTAEEQGLRELLGQILNALKLRGITSILVKELDRLNDETIAFEEYLVDASIRLHNVNSTGGGENLRQIEVRKTRGQPHLSGRHPFKLGPEGVVVYPRLRPVDVHRIMGDLAKPDRTRVSTGVRGVDAMLDGGLWNGSLNLVSGPPGTGKSVLAQHFIDSGLRAGENCLLLSIKNTPDQILAQAQSLQMDWSAAYRSGALLIRHHDPTTLCVEEMIDGLMRDLRTTQPRRLVLDSIDDLWAAVKDEDRVRDYVLVLAALFQAAGTTSIVLNEIRQLGGIQAGDVPDYSYLANTVIRLTASTHKDWSRRVIAVTKHAGSDHSKQIVDYHIDKDGFRVMADTPAPAGAPPTSPVMPAKLGVLLPETLPAPRRTPVAVPDALPAPMAGDPQVANAGGPHPVVADSFRGAARPDGSSSGSGLR